MIFAKMYNGTMVKSEMTVGEWLTQKFLKWQSDSGEIKTLSEFAELLDVSQPALSLWISGKRRPNEEAAGKLAVFGPEIYDLLGLERPDPQLRELRAKYDTVPPEHVQEFFKLVDQFLEERGWRRSGDIRPANHDKSE